MEQLNSFGQNIDDYKFYVVNDSKTRYRKLESLEKLGEWMLNLDQNGKKKYTKLYAQPKKGFKNPKDRIDELLPEWGLE